MSIVLIYPNQLFDLSNIPKDWLKHTFYLLEDPVYWGTDKKLILNMNQLKLVLHRSSMKYYENLLINKLGVDVKYIEESDLNGKDGYNFLNNSKEIYLFDPTDNLIMEKLNKMSKKIGFNINIRESPNFLITLDQLDEYIGQKKSVSYFHKPFYDWVKKKLDLNKIIGEKSYDKDNRKSLPKNITLPPIPKYDIDSPFITEAIQYIKKFYNKNYGNADEFYLPITHKSSEKWFMVFLEERFKNFGEYQDAITQKNPWIFHSIISPMMNIGLLDPKWILTETIKYYNTNHVKQHIGKNDLEGFIRQIIGWREYSRMLYIKANDEIVGNYFNHQGKLSKKWYEGTLGIEPVDWTIKTAFDKGYLHHILRLMVMANFMNLCEIHPDEVFKWFMEFSLDSYQWVMINNVYGMGLYADGGLTMSKPYLSSANYILKMSDFKKDGEWEVVWTSLFYRFLVKNEEKLKGTPYMRNLVFYKKLNANEKKEVIKKADDFIKKVSN
jgi:deoxyribodipyrimidine photolyase-related protein